MAISLDEFSRRLAESGLFELGDVIELAGDVPQELRGDGDALAGELVRRNRLTAYQAEQIAGGNGKSLVLGNYVVLELLGKGGMGVVLKAQHRRMKRVVALKVLSPSLVSTPEAVQRFQREVETVARLEHPNIVTAHDADEVNGTRFLVMQYIEGLDLAALVKQRGPLPLGDALSCIEQAARGLEFAHRNGVIHRDIKPANLLIDRSGVVRILDLGLARLFQGEGQRSEVTATGAVMGTVDYMAPEQAQSTKSADQRSDIYSLGMTLWHLLIGRPVYEDDSLISRLLAHREAPIPSLAARRADVPADVERLFEQMVAKRPEDRPASMAEVLDAVGQCRRRQGVAEPLDFVLQSSKVSAGSDGLGSSAVDTATAVAVTTAIERPARSLFPAKKVGAAIAAGALGAVVLWWRFSGSEDSRTIPATVRPAPAAASMAPVSTSRAVDRLTPRGLRLSGTNKIVVPTVIGTRDLRSPFTIELFVTPGELAPTTRSGLIDFEDQAELRIGSQIHEYYFQTVRGSQKLKVETPITALTGRRDHVAAVCANGRVRIYVNGTLAVDASVPEGPGPNIVDALEAGKTFEGVIEELRVSQMARYTDDFRPEQWLTPDASTLVLFHCDETSGNRLHDSSGKGNDGFIEGEGWTWIAGAGSKGEGEGSARQ